MKRTFALLAFGLAMSTAGCGYYWNEEAGAFLDQGEFGTATLNNQVAQTCRQPTYSKAGKYGAPLGSNCPPRKQDGKYADFAYQETIESATEAPSSTLNENLVISE